MKPEVIADYIDETGEGPMWHPVEKKLYWGDITEGELYTYDPTTGEHGLVFEAGQMFGGYTFQADGSILMFLEEGRIGVLRDGKLQIVVDGMPGENENRFNDVITDPEGRVFCGTMNKDSAKAIEREALGSLYRLDTDGTITKILDDIGISNGMGFTPDLRQMYYTDTTDMSIWLFDYDQATGELTNKRDFIRTPESDGLPDGMTVDAEGYVWSARVLTGEMHRYSPTGEKVLSVDFPTDMVSSAIFGGENMDELYVTTISAGDREAHGPGSGALYRLRPGVKGVPEFFSKVTF
jgi:D-xylonolactonase